LATAEGNLLENTSLIESLSRTKEKSAEIEEALVLSAQVNMIFYTFYPCLIGYVCVIYEGLIESNF
jgi:hypothetical protein